MTFALEACLWSLCGMSDESKSDPDMDTRTIKASAGMTTNPIPVDDGESLKKEAKLVTSAYDRTKYKTKNGTVKNVAVYMLTSNIMFRVERTGDREHIQVFHSYEGGADEARACKDARKRKVCMGETMKTGSRQAVIAIRISEPMFQVVNGTSMEHIQKIIAIIGGVAKQSTRKFLSDSEEVTEEEPKITEENIAQYNALLWPLKEVDSGLILRFCRLLGEPNFRSLADVDTPSGYSSALKTSNLLTSSGMSNTSASLSDEREASGSSDLMSSTFRDGAAIPNIEALFCSKCAEIFQTKAGRTKHLKVCKESGNFTRGDITVFTCNTCGYFAKSSRGLTQHKDHGANCHDRTVSRTMSRLELSVTKHECSCGKKLSTSQALGSHKLSCSGTAVRAEKEVSMNVTELDCCGRKFANKSALASHKRSKKHCSDANAMPPPLGNIPSASAMPPPPGNIPSASAMPPPPGNIPSAPMTQENSEMPRKQPVHPALENVRRRSSRLSISMSSAEGLPPISTADTSAPIVDDEVVNKFHCVCLKSYRTENGLRNHQVRFCDRFKKQPCPSSVPPSNSCPASSAALPSNSCPKCNMEFQSRSSLGLHLLTHM